MQKIKFKTKEDVVDWLEVNGGIPSYRKARQEGRISDDPETAKALDVAINWFYERPVDDRAIEERDLLRRQTRAAEQSANAAKSAALAAIASCVCAVATVALTVASSLESHSPSASGPTTMATVRK